MRKPGLLIALVIVACLIAGCGQVSHVRVANCRGGVQSEQHLPPNTSVGYTLITCNDGQVFRTDD